MRRGPAILLLFCLLFGSAYGALRLGQEGLTRLSTFAPTHISAERPTAGPSPLANRLVLLMIDGLRPEEAHLLPSLEWLRHRGASYRLIVPSPSFQPAAAATLLTGAPPELTGVMRPDFASPLGTDHLLMAAKRAQLSMAGAGSATLGRMVSGAVETWQVGSSSEELQDQIHSLLAPSGPRLILLQLGDLSRATRSLGTADIERSEYRDALADLDSRLAAILDQVDWKSTAVVVAGTTPLTTGGQREEGGSVPLLMAGAGVRQGARGDGSLMDVAPTVAGLAGLPVPLASQGKPLMEALNVDGRPADLIAGAYLASRQRFALTALKGYGSQAEVPDAPATVAEADGYLATLKRTVAAARQAWWQNDLMQRLPYLGGGLLVLLLYLLIVYRRPFGGPVFLATLIYAALFHLLFFGMGGRFSASTTLLDLPLTSLRWRLPLMAGIAMAVAAVFAGIALSRKSNRKIAYVATASLHMALGVAGAVALPMGVAVLLVGWRFPVAVPSASLWIWFFVTVAEVLVITALSPLWTAVTVRSARWAIRLWPPKEIGNPEINADKVVRLKALKRSERQVKSRRG